MDHLNFRWLLFAVLILLVGSCKKDDDTLSPATGNNSPSYPSTVTDIDGNVYFTVSIGDQRWMAENLRTAHYADGTEIPLAETISSWTGQGAAGLDAMCAYDNDPDNASIYGYLYNWYSATNPRGVCPQGWHAPSDTEWMQLEASLGVPAAELEQFSADRGAAQNVGGRLKSTSVLWSPATIGATNASGFTGLPSGYRSGSTGDFELLRLSGAWWSATTDQNPGVAVNRSLNLDQLGVQRAIVTKSRGFCVRCVAN